MTSSKTFYLIRHGIATHSKRGYGSKKFTAPILPEAIPSIMRLATFLKTVPTSANFSSEIIRCRETSAIITQITGKQFVFDARLNEENGEGVKLISTRVRSFLCEVIHRPEKDILICTHGVIIAAIKNILLTDKFPTTKFYDYCLPGELIILNKNSTSLLDFK